MTQRESIMRYIQNAYSAEAEYLWADTPDSAVFRHPSSKKWFGIIMTVPSSKLGLDGEGLVSILNVKCDPVMIGSLLMEKGFFPAYHMNKNNWLSILLDGPVPNHQITFLLQVSYDSVTPKRKRRKELENDAETFVSH